MPTFIDLKDYPRRDHFRYFCSLPNPYVGLTVPVDVTDLVGACQRAGASFFLCVVHAVALAADQVTAMQQRISGEGIVQYDRCPTSHIELLEDETYCYCTLHHQLPLQDYLTKAEAARQAARQNASIEEEDDADSMYFISCLPWLHYTAITQPTGNDSNPRFSWGKYEADHRGRLMLPMTVLCHHGLVDGIHIAQFYRHLDQQLALVAAQLND